ncbi:DUF1641 domain-containing protein [Sphaerisporangium sp. NPDC051017]|uniref:DUF1641 domain-containing protein n=1 Tax=unclassified Sphaerisporangium TaxID=2630420 RepID=UPI003402335C
MASDRQLTAPPHGDSVLSKLDDPRVAEALCDLLDHADLLAILVTGLDGFVRRGDTIAGGLAKAVGELRGAMAAAPEALKPLDLPKLATSLRTLSGAVSEATPGLELLLKSELTDPEVVELVSLAARSLRKGAEQARLEPMGPIGVFSLMRTLKDDDVARGLGFLIQVARALGREISET